MVIKSDDVAKCLPAGITLETVVSAKKMGFDNVTQTRQVSIVSVKETLTKPSNVPPFGLIVGVATMPALVMVRNETDTGELA